MNDERCVRDRVTAILTLADRVARGGLEADDFYESSATLLQDGIWAARRLLEALDTIDRTGNLHFPEYYGVDLQRCVHDQHPWPCPTEQALNGGNEQ